MIMAHFGGFEFTGFSVPLVFEGRYFIVEPGNPPLVTVVMAVEGEPIFEILKNNASAHDAIDVSVDSAGIVTVTDKTTGKILYNVHPGSETSVVFRKEDGGQCPAVITDTDIQIGGLVIDNYPLDGSMGGVIVDPEIGAGMLGAPLPPQVIHWLS
ncbi:MAG: hypothetical protein ACR2QU_00765 [Gammaproteobacteria bacterium]